MKFGHRQFFAHISAFLGTGVFWLVLDGGISFLLKGTVHPVVPMHAMVTALLSFGFCIFRRRDLEHDFGLIMLFRPISPESSLDDAVRNSQMKGTQGNE
ncbi:hypothetical protein [Candidatus Finniella inopinata]|uniref:Uncharacterized protein n=1 Tax=Candidatus Finniella inopinata TaxID=1696036 RepID=A0A4Q7DLE7_9PROT|nr:hypothetical protein [Candidatus Finniella inopinata]RZI47075.1 hypothetical protein EQU50_00365 [Candidatus Finniella inopinata]